MSVTFEVFTFEALDLNSFHDLLALRIDVFVVEQECPYSELDGKDKIAHHIIGRNQEGRVIATARILPPGISYKEVAIGRVVTAPSERGTGLGHQLMDAADQFIREHYGEVDVRISAQEHLEQFYKQHGFQSTGKRYLEDNIPHVEMLAQKE